MAIVLSPLQAGFQHSHPHAYTWHAFAGLPACRTPSIPPRQIGSILVRLSSPSGGARSKAQRPGPNRFGSFSGIASSSLLRAVAASIAGDGQCAARRSRKSFAKPFLALSRLAGRLDSNSCIGTWSSAARGYADGAGRTERTACCPLCFSSPAIDDPSLRLLETGSSNRSPVRLS
jgi:hypothetical protein